MAAAGVVWCGVGWVTLLNYRSKEVMCSRNLNTSLKTHVHIGWSEDIATKYQNRTYILTQESS